MIITVASIVVVVSTILGSAYMVEAVSASSTKAAKETAAEAVFQHSPEEGASLQREWEPGCQPDEIYDAVLPKWRAALRRWLVRRLRSESPRMAKLQAKYRVEWADRFFFWTSIFGTHTFFMTFLPLFFFFGDPVTARGLLYVTGLGIYWSSYIKDLACTPRPFSPPVTRLTISTHHHEYGFLSSHSTNSTSNALFLAAILVSSSLSTPVIILGCAALTFYAGSITFGRLYTGMHSTADVYAGTLLGVLCWGSWALVGPTVESWVETGSWLVPIIAIPLTLTLVHYHPEPVDDCPCFEDAIAVLATVLGSFMGHWDGVRRQRGAGLKGIGCAFSIGSDTSSVVSRVAFELVKLIVGIGIIFAWRLAAKAILHFGLPKLFRASSRILDFTLPTRKHYTAATEYQNYPPSPPGLHPVPSVVDLPTERQFAAALPAKLQSANKSRSSSPSEHLRLRKKAEVAKKSSLSREHSPAKAPTGPRYDADVLTKVVVYSGIGLLATHIIPLTFQSIERHVGLGC